MPALSLRKAFHHFLNSSSWEKLLFLSNFLIIIPFPFSSKITFWPGFICNSSDKPFGIATTLLFPALKTVWICIFSNLYQNLISTAINHFRLQKCSSLLEVQFLYYFVVIHIFRSKLICFVTKAG